MNKDLTVGKPSAVLWKFCLPLFGSIIFQQLYNIADSFVAGKFIGEDALAAVGNSYEITLIFLAFAFGCNIGCSVVVSRLFGEKRYGRLKTAVYTTVISSSALCAVLMLIGLSLDTCLLNIINTPENVFSDSELYLKIYIFGLPFIFLYNISTGVFSALGDSKTPFLFLVISSLANIGADIVFVVVFDMGVAGVAWATFICQGVACILAIVFVMLRLKKIETDEKVKVFSGKLLGEIAVIAVPSILQQSFVSVGNIIIQGVINTFGSSVMAGYSGAIKLNNLVITSLTTLANGISNYTAQNIGACKLPRVREGYKAGLLMVACICVPIVVLYTAIPEYILRLFLDETSELALSTGVMFLRIVSPFYFVVSVKLVSDAVLRGSKMMVKFMITTFTDLILRVTLAVALSAPLGATGVWIAWPIGWVIGTALSVCFYLFKKPISKSERMRSANN